VAKSVIQNYKKNIPIKKIQSFIHGKTVKEVLETFLKRKLTPEELKIFSNEKSGIIEHYV